MTIVLTLNNSTCLIAGLSEKQFKQLREILSYRVPSMGRIDYQNPNTKRYLLTKRGTYPSGLNYLVIRYLRKNNLNYNIEDLRIAPESLIGRFKLSLVHTPYTAQKAAVEACRRFNHGMVVMPTGTGKSLTMALLVKEYGLKTLIVVPSLELKNQLTADFKKCFGALKNITIENIDSKALQRRGDHELLIIDEAHHAASATYQKLNSKCWDGIYHKFFFTATPYRSQDHERLILEGIVGHVIYRLTYKEAVAANMIVPIEAYYLDLPKQSVEGFTWAEVYKELVTENQHRNMTINALLQRLEDAGISALCLVKEIAHGNRLVFPFVNGQDEESRELISKFNNREINVLVGTSGIIGEGVDTRPCEYVVIAGLGKSRNAFVQQVGRCVRKYPGKESGKVIIFNDFSHKWTRAHFREQVKILKEEYGVETIKLY